MKLLSLILASGLTCTALDLLQAQQQPIEIKSPFPDTVLYKEHKTYTVYLDMHKTICGFIDIENDSLIYHPAQYDYLIYRAIPELNTTVYMAHKDGKAGVLNMDRSVLVPFEYTDINYNIKQNLIYVKKDSLYGILRTDGTAFMPVEYDDILFDGSYYKTIKGKKVGLNAADGQEILPACFDNIEDQKYMDDALLQQGNKWSVLRWVKDAPCDMKVYYQQVEYFNQYFLVKENNKWGVVDKDKKGVLPLEYHYIMPFFQRFLQTLLVVSPDKKLGLIRIDSTGKVIEQLPMIYDQIWVEDNTQKVKVKQGKFVDYIYDDKPYLGLKYNDVVYNQYIDAFTIKTGKLWGLANGQGKITMQPQFDKLYIIDGKNFVVQKKGKWGMVGATGNVKIPITYDEFEYDHAKSSINMYDKKDDRWQAYKIR